jgi:hypothetical protein
MGGRAESDDPKKTINTTIFYIPNDSEISLSISLYSGANIQVRDLGEI